MKYVKPHTCHETLRTLFLSIVRSKMLFGILLKPPTFMRKLETLHNQGMRIISGSFPGTPIGALHHYLDLQPLTEHQQAISARTYAALCDLQGQELALDFDAWTSSTFPDDPLYDVSPYGKIAYGISTLLPTAEAVDGLILPHWTEDLNLFEAAFGLHTPDPATISRSQWTPPRYLPYGLHFYTDGGYKCPAWCWNWRKCT
jgi:hypothetical protein